MQELENPPSDFLPQANSLEKIAILVKAILRAPVSIGDVKSGLSFSERQAKYYIDAISFLEIAIVVPYWTEDVRVHPGLLVMKKEAFDFFIRNGRNVEDRLRKWIIEKEFLIKYEKALISSKNNGSTLKRRTQSLNAWGKWVSKLNDKK